MLHNISRHWRTIAAVGALGSAVFALTGASGLWSDTSNVNGNQAQAGIISVDARPVDNKPIASNLIIDGIGGLLPGEQGDPGTVDVYNDGSRAQNQYMHVTNVSGGLCNYVSLKLGWSFAAPNAFDNVIGTYSLSSLTGPGNRVEVGRWHPVPANFTTRVVQAVILDAGTPQAFQGETCTWDEVFTGEQSN